MAKFDFSKAVYACAAHRQHQWPPDRGVEVAFAGRSNVGKSSAINAIANHKQLARASKTPGRTQQIVFFDVDAEHRLVDLPGYGYANVPTQLRRHWQRFVTDYVTQRACLRGMVVPMDIRRPLTELDQTMLRCCWQTGVPTHILLTKADKLTRARANQALAEVRRTLTEQPHTTVQLFSAVKRHGVAQAREILCGLLSQRLLPQQPS